VIEPYFGDDGDIGSKGNLVDGLYNGVAGVNLKTINIFKGVVEPPSASCYIQYMLDLSYC
jgi:hypothetical protein